MSDTAAADRKRKGAHGMRNTRTYSSWKNMRLRCRYPAHHHYDLYGGRGIRVCEHWLDGDGVRSGFECFLADMGERPEGTTLDRIDNDGHYEPGNCRWATHKDQQANKRPFRPGGKPGGPPRRTHCKRGHPLVPENVSMLRNGRGYFGRHCRVCLREGNRIRGLRLRQRKALAQAARRGR